MFEGSLKLIMFAAAFALGAPVVAITPVRGEDAAVVTDYRGPDRQERLEAGARKEGQILLYTTGTQIEPLIERFKEKYPFLRIEQVRADPQQAAARAMQEYATGLHIVDGYELTSFSLAPLHATKALAPIHSPEAASFAQGAIGPDRNWIIVRESYAGIGYNSAKLAAADAPKTFADLLAPQWRGKMAIIDSSTSVAFVAAMSISQGDDFVLKFKQQRPRVYNITARALANFVISGEVLLSPTIYNSHVIASKAAGASIEWVAPGPVVVNDSAVAVASHAPHPHAMMLLTDFFLSPEGQAMYMKLGYNSPRSDMQSPEDKDLKKIYLSSLPDFETAYERWTRLYEATFLK